ncbi:MAG TPA: ABC transporter ATP-binding protein [Candidatus Nitrosotenuis sp.]|nr:ABC transporter ATP-binding protein [Candidatus Nitrosotenuis sp.]
MLLKFIWTYARRYRLPLFLAVVSMLMFNAASMVRPHLVKVLTDRTMTGADVAANLPLLGWLLAALLGATVVKGIFEYAMGMLMIRASAGTVRDLREDVYTHMLRLPVGWFDRHQVGDLVVRFTDDTRQVGEFFSNGVATLANDLFVLAFSLVWMFSQDWKLSLVAVSLYPLTFLTSRRMSRRLARATEMAQKRLSDLSSLVSETVRGIRVVKAFNTERKESERFSRHNEESFRSLMKIVQYAATQSPVQEVLGTLAIVLVISYCAHNIITGQQTIGELLAFWAYMLLAVTPANRTPDTMVVLHRGLTALARLREIRLAGVDEPEGLPALVRPAGAVEFDKVRFRYQEGREEALKGLGLTLRPGEKVAVVGRNGAGKSTLAQLLLRFYLPDSGRITLDGQAIDAFSAGSVRQHVTFVAQETFLFSGTVRENIAYGRPQATQEEIEQAARLAGAHDMICSLSQGYDTPVGERGAGLSGGQRQKIALARAILRDPAVVVLDEVTANLDPQAEVEVQAALDRALEGRTVLNITHRLAAAAAAQRVVVVDDGRVVQVGTHAELLGQEGVYNSLYGSQSA